MLPRPVSCLVEGALDEAVVRRVFAASSLEADVFYRRSLPAFKTDLRKINQAANTSCWFAMPLALTYDCRVLDGTAGVRFRRWIIDAWSRCCCPSKVERLRRRRTPARVCSPFPTFCGESSLP